MEREVGERSWGGELEREAGEGTWEEEIERGNWGEELGTRIGERN